MKTAADVMNKSYFHASPSDSIGALLLEMAERGLGSVPVLDRNGRPLGVATTAEIERCYDVDELTERLRRPALCMNENTPIEAAARTLALHPSCCLLLVNGCGVAVGALTALELLRAVLGVEEIQAALRRERDARWDDAEVLEIAAAHRAPEAPGIILLSPGLDEHDERIVWAEASVNMRERLDQMLREPQDDARLESILEVYPRTVRFRCLTIDDPAQREQLVDALCNMGGQAGRGSREREPDVSSHPSGIMPRAVPAVALDT